jgi:hypothetical protein
MVFTPLRRRQTRRRRGRNGWRFYNEYLLPDEFEGKTRLVRLDATPEDAARRFNRAENLRAIPPGDPDFERLYARRSDAESINRALEDTLFLNRAHSVGRHRQEADLLGYSLMVNAITRARHRDSRRPLAA